ncbi:hypothetical protein [Modestobacter lacusdianchii]
MTHWPPITRDDLGQAAGSDGFAGVLPQLVRRLIAETADGLTELDMPGEGGVAMGGFDGVVTTSGSTVELPAGTSVWELSVTQGSGKKVTIDYPKRLSAPRDLPTAEVTYVQLILAPWKKAAAWASERTADGRWREVRALNLDGVRSWLDRAPATAVWLAERLGKAVPGARLADDWFERTWLLSTRVSLDRDAVLAGRERAATDLLAVLARGASPVTLGGDMGADEFRAVVAATIDSADEPTRASLKARTLFVDDAAALARLTALPQPLVLVVVDARLAASAPASNPHQIIALAPPGGDANITLDRVDAQAVAGLLKAGGESPERAHELGALARRSLSALRRHLAVHPSTLRPVWADAADVVVRRLALLGSWDGSNEDDRALIERVTERRWIEVQDAALALARNTDIPLLGRLDESWYVVSPSDASLLLQPDVTGDDLAALEKAAIDVLTAPDPLFGLRGPDVLRAQMAGQRRPFSTAVQHGVARSLALLGSAAPSTASGTTAGVDVARRTVRRVLTAANADPTYAVWTGLCHVLTELAEAAPEEFLDAMRAGLRGADMLHASMFTDSRDEDPLSISGPSARHSEFLWALEILAWSPTYFEEAVDILATLAAVDPGGRYSNRPARSLADIFSCWHPMTAADEQQREATLRQLLRTHPNVARTLLATLIPDGRDVQFGHDGPRYRDWKREPVLTHADVDRNARTAGALLLESVGEDQQALLAAIAKIDHLAPEHRRALCDSLSQLGRSLVEDADRAALSEALRSVAAHHREYSDADWALPAEEIEPIETAAAALAPRDVVNRHLWLFAKDWVDIGGPSRRDDLQDYDRRVRDMRAAAMVEIVAGRGLDGVSALAEATPSAYLVGAGLARADGVDADGDMLRWIDDERPRSEVGYAYFAERLRLNAQAVEDLVAAAPSAVAKAAVLRAAGDPGAAWVRLAALGEDVTRHYWQQFGIYGLGGDFQQIADAVRGLLSVGRAAAALGLISLYSGRVDTLEVAELAADACEALLRRDDADPELHAVSVHGFETVVSLLHRHRHELDRQRLVNIEWQLFPALGFEADAPMLFEALADEPAFFVELAQLVLRPDAEAVPNATADSDAGSDDEEVLPLEAARATRFALRMRAFEVLHAWRRVPGAGAEGVIDAERLNAWVDDARRMMAERDRRIGGDHEIGKILAYAAPDAEGLAPPRAVRDLLERVASNELDDGFSLGTYDRRGVTSRGMLEGGDQERSLAATFREQAAIAGPWPRSRRLLRRLAEDYEREATSNDETAERRRRGLDR